MEESQQTSQAPSQILNETKADNSISNNANENGEVTAEDGPRIKKRKLLSYQEKGLLREIYFFL